MSTIRACDAEPLLRAKEELRKTLADTDSNAVFEDGNTVPVFIRNGGSQLYIERHYDFADPETIEGFVRFVQKPIPAEAQAAHTPTRQLKGSNYHETRTDAARLEEQGRINKERARKEAQGITQADIDAGNAMYEREAQEKVRARNADRRKPNWRKS
jgi:hypothetical protein